MKTDITIVGAGLAGLIASIKFSQMGYKVICIDFEGEKNRKNDIRSTALLLPSISFLDELGVWTQIKSYAAPLQAMRITDISNEQKTHELEFRANEIGEEEFGFNVQNQALYQNLTSFSKKANNVDFILNDKFTNVRTRTNTNFVELESGLIIQSKLLIGADGRKSSVRDKLNLSVKTKSYNQNALAFKVKHAKSHRNVSTEIYKSGGPFTIIPLTDQKQSAVIWMDSTNNIRNLIRLSKAEFNKAITNRSGNCLGPLSQISELTNWPIINQYTKNLTGERSVLIAEAAHVLPPIGAQGLNMSIQDIRTLANIVDGEHDPGSPHSLKIYEKKRNTNSKLRIKLIDGLNLASRFNRSHALKARSMAIQLIASSPKLKNILINAGLGELT